MPSLHVAFAVVTGAEIAGRSDSLVVKAAAHSYAPLVATVVAGTGNHYALDAIAGAALGRAQGYLRDGRVLRATPGPRSWQLVGGAIVAVLLAVGGRPPDRAGRGLRGGSRRDREGRLQMVRGLPRRAGARPLCVRGGVQRCLPLAGRAIPASV